MAQQLQSALVGLQILVLDHALQVAVEDQVLQRVAKVATQLHEDLAAVLTATHTTAQLEDFANCETEQENHKESFTVHKSIIMLAQEEMSTVLGETIPLNNELKKAHDEQATESNVDPVVSQAAELGKAIIIEVGSQLNKNAKETTAVGFEQITSMDSADNVAMVEMKQTVDETISAECVAVSNVEIMILDSEVLVPKETFKVTEQKVGIDEGKDEVVDDNKVKEVNVQEKEDISEKRVNLEALNQEAASNIISDDGVKGPAQSDKVVEVSTLTIGNSVFRKLYRLTITNHCQPDFINNGTVI